MSEAKAETERKPVKSLLVTRQRLAALIEAHVPAAGLGACNALLEQFELAVREDERETMPKVDLQEFENEVRADERAKLEQGVSMGGLDAPPLNPISEGGARSVLDDEGAAVAEVAVSAPPVPEASKSKKNKNK